MLFLFQLKLQVLFEMQAFSHSIRHTNVSLFAVLCVSRLSTFIRTGHDDMIWIRNTCFVCAFS